MLSIDLNDHTANLTQSISVEDAENLMAWIQ